MVDVLDTRPHPTPFAIRVEPDRDRIVVVPCGELDMSTTDRFDLALREQFEVGFAVVVADLRDLTFLDSSGIRALYRAHVEARRAGRTLQVIPGDGAPRRALALTGLLERFDLVQR